VYDVCHDVSKNPAVSNISIESRLHLYTNVNFPDEDTEMSKHVAVYIIQRDTVVIYNRALVGCNKTEVNSVPKTERLKNYINTSGSHKSLWNALLASNNQKLVYLHCSA
jgi:hypothetical protein